jgi:hypothetical protein
MKKCILVICLSVFFAASSSFADVVDQCPQTLLKVTTDLLHDEGFDRINSCMGNGSSDNCQLEIYFCKAIENTHNRLCSLRYTYGGGYSNYNDYLFTVDSDCQILKLEITRL